MAEIQAPVSNYALQNVFNVDESGLFYRMAPRHSYLVESEIRRDVCGTEFQKQKSRLSMVFCVNTDGSHMLPMKYIGKSKAPRCFEDARFSQDRNYYSSQANAWMDSKSFKSWVQWRYTEVKVKLSGP